MFATSQRIFLWNVQQMVLTTLTYKEAHMIEQSENNVTL